MVSAARYGGERVGGRAAATLVLMATMLSAMLLTASAAMAATGGVERTAVPGFSINELRIADPRRYWRQHGFKLMSPAIRVSVAAHTGARTQVFLRIGPEGDVRLRSTDGAALTYPPGSEADRVSYVRYRSSGGLGYTIDDVRGTRWDEQGREWFHVYRASGPEPHAPLIGYEWLRDDNRAAREATRRLAQIVDSTLLPNALVNAYSTREIAYTLRPSRWR